MKTNPLKATLIGLVLLCEGVAADNAFECLRDLMQVTDRAILQAKRENVEEPFLANEKFIVFPEIFNKVVTGFFFFGHKGGAYYDAVEFKKKTVSIGDLKYHREDGIYELVAQPAGLETVAVSYLPGFRLSPKTEDGPVLLGTSVLPVIGAFVSRPELAKSAYLNPKALNETEVKRWVADRMGDRRPANVGDIKINTTILKLKTIQRKTGEELWRPLRQELKLRKNWIQNHNLDEKAFKQLSLIMEGSCKE